MSIYIDGEKLLKEFNDLVQIANDELNNLSNQSELDFKAKHYEWRRWATILSERGIYAYKVEKAMDEGVEIVRCKECKYCNYWYADKGVCIFWDDNHSVYGDDFCNHGERSEKPDKRWQEFEKRQKRLDPAKFPLFEYRSSNGVKLVRKCRNCQAEYDEEETGTFKVCPNCGEALEREKK